MTNLPRYLTYSFLFHITLIGWLTIIGLTKKTKTYYSVDFFGGMPAASGRSAEEIIEKPIEEVKTKLINPQEDLLIKSKKKPSKKEKEVLSTVPSVPSAPVLKAPKQIGTVPSAVPGVDSSGVGIGLGDGGSGTGAGGAGNFPYTWYVHSIKKKLDANWNVTKGFSQRIYTQVAFTINKDGSLTKIEVEESSKNEVFDRAAVRAVEAGNPFPPLPSDFPEPDIRVHVRFTVKKY